MERLTKREGTHTVRIGNEWRRHDPIWDRLAACEDELEQHETAEEQGLILRLPCAVGDTVWLLQKKCKHAGANNEPWKNCNQYWDNVLKKGMWGCAGKDDQGNSLICEKKEMELYAKQMEYTIVLYSPNIVLGENLFLTKAEAEKALEEMERK